MATRQRQSKDHAMASLTQMLDDFSISELTSNDDADKDPNYIPSSSLRQNDAVAAQILSELSTTPSASRPISVSEWRSLLDNWHALANLDLEDLIRSIGCSRDFFFGRVKNIVRRMERTSKEVAALQIEPSSDDYADGCLLKIRVESSILADKCYWVQLIFRPSHSMPLHSICECPDGLAAASHKQMRNDKKAYCAHQIATIVMIWRGNSRNDALYISHTQPVPSTHHRTLDSVRGLLLGPDDIKKQYEQQQQQVEEQKDDDIGVVMDSDDEMEQKYRYVRL
jgi:hypothetical protein